MTLDLSIDQDTYELPIGMPLSVFNNKYSRKRIDGTFQSWEERITEVVQGNFGVVGDPIPDSFSERQWYEDTLRLAKKGVLPFAGRHLQHGQVGQQDRSGEYLTNCSTAMFSFMVFFLLLKNSGVGRCYDSDICFINWDYMPEVRLVLDGPDAAGIGGHPDYEPWIESLADARHRYGSEDSEHVRWFDVADSIEGWVKMVMVLETAAFHRNNKDTLFIFNFTPVRERGRPVKGQQNRPASGPVPLIKAMMDVCRIKGAGMPPWKQALFIDHFLAACVMLGGIRRSARMATKNWRDKDAIEFIDIKRGGNLYTANNSITVDEEFWEQAKDPRPSHARRVFEAATAAAYYDGTGEPGFINIDKLEFSMEGVEDITADNYIVNSNVQESLPIDHPRTKQMIEYMLTRAKAKKYPYIVNPCSEIVLSVWGGYCVIGDIAMAHASNEQDLILAARCMAQFLVRANCQQYLYDAEVKRTNRIGVGLTGVFEWAYKQYGLTFFDLIKCTSDELEHCPIPNEKEKEIIKFWHLIKQMKQAVSETAEEYTKYLTIKNIHLPAPHTDTCMKPSGTISKVMGPLTEAAHLPAYGFYIRWVQENIHEEDKIEQFKAHGYPIKDVSHQYTDTVIVGYPTCLPIAQLMGKDLVTMEEVNWEEQIRWIELLEHFWIGERGNQVSYTLKYDPEQVSFEAFRKLTLDMQPKVRCCAVMPQIDESAYAYTPEQKISYQEYEDLMANITPITMESYNDEDLNCEGGVCPIDLDINNLEEAVA